MVKLALALAFLAVFGLAAVFLLAKLFPPKKEEEKKTTTRKKQNKNEN